MKLKDTRLLDLNFSNLHQILMIQIFYFENIFSELSYDISIYSLPELK